MHLPIVLATALALLPVASASSEGVDERSAFRLGEALVLPAPDLAKLELEDAKRVGGPMRYGVAIPLEGLSLASPGLGRWSREGELAVWRLELVSPGARSLDFHFSRLELPLGAELRIVGEGKGNERRIEARHLSGSAFYSPYVAGERAPPRAQGAAGAARARGAGARGGDARLPRALRVRRADPEVRRLQRRRGLPGG
ncbi:MAG: hypothetical protein RML12_10240 [Xanthomonadales bacterium]|nr:hypothetical protein [Xanthomonadales bacterium]